MLLYKAIDFFNISHNSKYIIAFTEVSKYVEYHNFIVNLILIVLLTCVNISYITYYNINYLSFYYVKSDESFFLYWINDTLFNKQFYSIQEQYYVIIIMARCI